MCDDLYETAYTTSSALHTRDIIIHRHRHHRTHTHCIDPIRAMMWKVCVCTRVPVSVGVRVCVLQCV